MVKLAFWKNEEFTLENYDGELRIYRQGVVGYCECIEEFFKPDDSPEVVASRYCTRAGEPVLVVLGTKRAEPEFEGFRLVISLRSNKILSRSTYLRRMPRRRRLCR